MVILAGGLLLRLHDYTAAPRPPDNVDELAWTWAGLSLLEDHRPTSWSFLPAYPHPVGILEPGTNRALPLVSPWFDHPPLFALAIGAFAWLAGERSLEAVSDTVIRLPVIALSLLTMLLLYALARRLVGDPVALVAILLFAVAPGAVLGSRLVESEALLAPLLLLVLLVTDRIVSEEAGRLDMAVLLAACLLAPLVKVPGAAFGPIAAVVLAASSRFRPAGLALTMSALGLLAYAWYGALIDLPQFLAVLDAQAHRHMGLISGYEFITAPAGFSDAVRLHDGWWLLGWIALAEAGRRAGRIGLLLAWPVVAFGLAITLLGDPSAVDRYGWYRFAIYPLVYLLAAQFAVATVRRPNVVRVALLLILPGAAATLALGSTGAPWNPPLTVTALLAGAVLVSTLAGNLLARREEGPAWLPQAGIAIPVAAMVALNIAQSFRLADVYTFL